MKTDRYGQPKGELSDFDLKLLSILEDVSCESVSPEKSLLAYVVDIKRAIRAVI